MGLGLTNFNSDSHGWVLLILITRLRGAHWRSRMHFGVSTLAAWFPNIGDFESPSTKQFGGALGG
jgi:hypothetical protein